MPYFHTTHDILVVCVYYYKNWLSYYLLRNAARYFTKRVLADADVQQTHEIQLHLLFTDYGNNSAQAVLSYHY